MAADVSRCRRHDGLFITFRNVTALLPGRPPAERCDITVTAAMAAARQHLQRRSRQTFTAQLFFISIFSPPGFVATTARIYFTTSCQRRQRLSINNNSSKPTKVNIQINFKVKCAVGPNVAITIQFAVEQLGEYTCGKKVCVCLVRFLTADYKEASHAGP